MIGISIGMGIGIGIRAAGAVDREAGLTLTNTLAIGEDEDNTKVTEKTSSVVFAFDITGLDASVGEGVILDAGGTGVGSMIYVSAAGDLAVRQRSGNPTLDNAPHVTGTCPTGNGTLVVEFNVTTGQPKVWWNGDVFGTNGAVTSTGSWAGSEPSAYFGISGSVSNDAPTVVFTGYASASTLRHYASQVVL